MPPSGAPGRHGGDAAGVSDRIARGIQVWSELGFGEGDLGLSRSPGITRTGASSESASGLLVFGVVVEGTYGAIAWLVSGLITLLAAATVFLGRRYLLLRDRATEKGI